MLYVVFYMHQVTYLGMNIKPYNLEIIRMLEKMSKWDVLMFLLC